MKKTRNGRMAAIMRLANNELKFLGAVVMTELGFKLLDTLTIPRDYDQQQRSSFPFCNNVRLAADRLGLKGKDRIVMLTAVEFVFDTASRSKGGIVNIMGRLPTGGRPVMVGTVRWNKEGLIE